jgi:hypothetical protein
MRAFVIVLLALHLSSVFSQDIQISRHYAGSAKNVPVHIFNHNEKYFYVLRYNRSIHDLVLERRSKPGAELQRIYPLRLDSVNSKWFDYEKLDYLLFEKNKRLYFVFVKELNTESAVFMKTIDSAGTASGFISIATATTDLNKATLQLKISLDEQNNLAIQTRYSYSNSTQRIQVSTYDLERRTMVRKWNLPIENSLTGYSACYTTSADSVFYYMQVYSRLQGFVRKYSAQGSFDEPVFVTDSLKFMKLSRAGTLEQARLPFNGLYNQFNIEVLPDSSRIHIVFRAGGKSDSGYVQNHYSCRVNPNTMQVINSTEQQLLPSTKKQLNYFDGSDIADAGAKVFWGLRQKFKNRTLGVMEGRREGYYYKEILFWQYSCTLERIVVEQLIPRKLFYFPNRTAYRQQAEIALVEAANGSNFFLLEHRNNGLLQPADYNYKRFEKQSQLRTGILVQYTINANQIKKRIVFENAEFDFIPLRYDGWEKDFVFYLAKFKAEKFAILKALEF